MQQSQRAAYNHALEYAVQQANKQDRMLLVAFGLTDDYPEANLRHYTFMLEGLKETQATLASRGIKLVVRRGQSAGGRPEAWPSGIHDCLRPRIPETPESLA